MSPYGHHHLPSAYSVLHFSIALLIAIAAGGVTYLMAGTVFSFIMGGAEAVDNDPVSLAGSLAFAILLVGLFGGIPGILIGAILLASGARSTWGFVAAGVVTSVIAPLLVMAFTPIGATGWSMLVVAIPSGAVAGYAAHRYLEHRTTLLN